MTAKEKCLRWLAVKHPDYFARLNFGLNGIGAIDWNQIINIAKDVFIAKSGADAQKKCIMYNLERAKAGLDPVDCSATAPQVNVGVDPKITKAVQTGIYAGLAFLAWIVFRGRR